MPSFQPTFRFFAPIRGLCPAVLGALASLALAMPDLRAAEERDARPGPARISDVDTEHMFGETTGSDIEEPGNIVPHFNSRIGIGKRGPVYGVFDQNAEIKYGLVEGLAVSAAVNGLAARIRGVPGLPDTYGGGPSGFALQARWRLLDRTKSPVGFTMQFAGAYDSRDPVAARPARVWSGAVRAAFDSELIFDRLFGAFNLFYETQSISGSFDPEAQSSSTGGVSAALSTRIADNAFAGFEMSYQRAYAGNLMGRLQGEAFYLGPTVYLTAGKAWLTLSWTMQVAGREVGGAGPLNLRDFERHRVLVVFGKAF
jgi:hypothetical protein